MEKINIMGKHFYTNGTKTIKLSDTDIIPEGFWKGRTFNINTWNKGLTAETDVRVKRNTDHCHETRRQRKNYHSWNKGLTKETNASLKRVSEILSVVKKGKPSWNLGLHWSEEWKQNKSYQMKQIASTKTQEDWDEVARKSYETKRRNNSFNTSSDEEAYYNYLLQHFEETDILRQYRDERYPFNCDFYIKSLDLFIEIQANWTHCYKPFDEKDAWCQKHLAYLQQKKRETHKKFYSVAIDVWTKSDVRKYRDYLQKNNLNFMLIYPDGLVITQ